MKRQLVLTAVLHSPSKIRGGQGALNPSKVLTVDASEYHMVDASPALLPYLSGHIVLNHKNRP